MNADAKLGWMDRLSHFVHRRLIWLLMGTYVLAALVPGPGLAIRDVTFGTFSLLGESVRVTLPVLMLASLLFNSGLGVQPDRLRRLARGPLMLAVGLAANLAVPILFILAVSQGMRFWHNADEVQNILVGLALIASMPIAGSSTAWSQNANGDMSLSLGLVLGSTLLSPLTTPLALHAVGFIAEGDYASDLHELAVSGAGGFLVVGVLLPSLLGILGRLAAGEARVSRLKPRLKLANSAILLVLNYSNASISLPRAVSHPDWDFLIAILTIATGLCALAFASGWGISRALRADAPRRTSLMFGLGMNNNGSGLVLASLMLADHPRVMLPIIVYNLVQHLIAGVVDALSCRPDRPSSPDASPGRPGEVDPVSGRTTWLELTKVHPVCRWGR